MDDLNTICHRIDLKIWADLPDINNREFDDKGWRTWLNICGSKDPNCVSSILLMSEVLKEAE